MKISAAARLPYSHADLARLLSPASIAVVGASERVGSFGERTITNLSDFAGELYFVNPRYETIFGKPSYSGLSALPVVPDCVVLAIAASEVERLVAEAVQLGIGGVIIFASGFAETAEPEAVALQDRIAGLVRGTATRLIGPNCIGIFNHAAKAQMSFTIVKAPAMLRRPAIGIVSQSGALGNAVGQAAEHGASISQTLTAGNSCDVDIADLVSYLADDDSCDAIACMFEGLADPLRLITAAERARHNGKTVVVYKMATGNIGAAAAKSHTGALAGSNAAYDAAFEHAGMIQVQAIEDLIETTVFFAKAPQRPVAPGVAVLSISGGAGIIAADKAEAHGVDLPTFSPATADKLAGIIPAFGSPKNPCDMTAELLKKPDMLAQCAEAVFSEDTIGAVIYPHPFARDGAIDRVRILSKAAQRSGKMLCTVWLTEYLEGPGAREVEENPHVALFRSMDRCFAALKAWQTRSLAAPGRSSDMPVVLEPQRDAVSRQLAATKTTVIGETAAKDILARYGIPVVRERLVPDADAAIAALRDLPLPLAAKIDSPDIPHKTEAGMVFLNIQSEKALREAAEDMLSRAAAMVPRPRLNGIVLQPMIPAGLELVVGGRIDPQFGPMVVFGLGGTLVEVLRDSIAALAPLSPAEAKVLLPRLKGYRLLCGYRGSPAVDIEKLGEIISNASHFLADHQDRIAELDINPLIATPNGLVAVDALIVLNQPSQQ